MTIAFWHWLMSYACILHTPTHTIPNKSCLGEGLGAFPTRGEGREKERERNISAWLPLSHPYGGAVPQSRHVPWLGFELVTLWFAGWCSVPWATLARALLLDSLLGDYIFLENFPFHSRFQISWHIDVHSNFLQSFYFCDIGCNFSSFISDFIYLHPLPFFLDESG